MELLLSLIGGGATGLLGSMFSRVFGYFEQRQTQRFILEKYRLDAEERAKERESERLIAESSEAADMLTASFRHDASYGQGSQWVVNLLRLVRPCLTLLLWLLVALIWLTLEAEYDYQGQILSTILYCATAATLWWFGTRDRRR